MNVMFERSEPRRFDLVIGADGLHSTVRRLRFGAESAYLRELGYYVAVFTTDNFSDSIVGVRMFNVPGRAAGVYSSRQHRGHGHDGLRFAADRPRLARRCPADAGRDPGVHGRRLGGSLPRPCRRHATSTSPPSVPFKSRAGRAAGSCWWMQPTGDQGRQGTGSAIVGGTSSLAKSPPPAAITASHSPATSRSFDPSDTSAGVREERGRSPAPINSRHLGPQHGAPRPPLLPRRHALGRAAAKAANGIVLPDYSSLGRAQPESTVEVAHLLLPNWPIGHRRCIPGRLTDMDDKKAYLVDLELSRGIIEVRTRDRSAQVSRSAAPEEPEDLSAQRQQALAPCESS